MLPMKPTLTPPRGIKPIRFGNYLYFFDRDTGRSFYVWSPPGASIAVGSGKVSTR